MKQVNLQELSSEVISGFKLAKWRHTVGYSSSPSPTPPHPEQTHIYFEIVKYSVLVLGT